MYTITNVSTNPTTNDLCFQYYKYYSNPCSRFNAMVYIFNLLNTLHQFSLNLYTHLGILKQISQIITKLRRFVLCSRTNGEVPW